MRILLAATVVLALSPASAEAASQQTCDRYAKQLERLIVIGTNDADVAQLVYQRAQAYCFVIDQPPLEISMDEDRGIAPAAAKPKVTETPGFAADWIAACKRRYSSFRDADGTVLRRGSRNRVRCPVKS